ncbi:msl9291 (plasmid) [Mesorhizobium japonicum MAFF 303099]|uniref:Msl9291 protein n=1 Tax=Mesorhizobium japonicum (strain LMG 29417 / CECT 9101 / MAFF 303099) TaxID=266835 RepID=Q981P2_RHILO|nr:msl9291 [Mesorhizobium japonicum MAFF 303099]
MAQQTELGRNAYPIARPAPGKRHSSSLVSSV